MKFSLKRARDEAQTGQERLGRDLDDLLAASEELLRSTADKTGEGVDDARRKLKGQLESLRSRASDWKEVAADRAARLSKETDAYVHENAWKSMGIAALVGIGVSLLARTAVKKTGGRWE